jgi:hypothetical protein
VALDAPPRLDAHAGATHSERRVFDTSSSLMSCRYFGSGRRHKRARDGFAAAHSLALDRVARFARTQPARRSTRGSCHPP